MSDEKLNWRKTEKLGLQKNLFDPMLSALKESLKHEKSELERKLKNLKMLGVISTTENVSIDELNKKLKEFDSTSC